MMKKFASLIMSLKIFILFMNGKQVKEKKKSMSNFISKNTRNTKRNGISTVADQDHSSQEERESVYLKAKAAVRLLVHV